MFLSADVAKTIHPVLMTHLLHTEIKLTCVPILASFTRYEPVLVILNLMIFVTQNGV